jgi:tetratricopeptide (TPR) repeat protein
MLAVAGLLAGAVAWYARRPAPAEPPAVDLDGLDPALAAAVTEGREAVRRSPGSATPWGELGMLLAVHHLGNEALPCFAEAERLAPRDYRWPYHQALVRLGDDPTAALPKLRQAAALTDAEGPHLRLAELALALGQVPEAEEQYREVLRQSPGHPRAHLGLARAALARDDPGAAAENLRPAADNPASRKAAARLRADLLLRAGDRPGAAQAQDQAAALPDDRPWPDPDVTDLTRHLVGEAARYRAAERLVEERRYPEAVGLLRELVRENPASARYGLYLAFALRKANDPSGAEAALREVLRHTPDSPRAHLELGIVRLGLGRRDEATASFRRAAELKPDYADALDNLAGCLRAAGDRAGAADAYRRALLCQPQSPRLHAALAELLLEGGQAAEARDHLRQAVQLDPNDERARRLLADAEKR